MEDAIIDQSILSSKCCLQKGGKTTNINRHMFAFKQQTVISKVSTGKLQNSGVRSISQFIKKGKLVTKPKLELSDLIQLFTHEITALQIKSFYPPLHAAKLGNEIAKKAKTEAENWKVVTERGLEVSEVYTLGEHVPYNVAVAMNQTDEYFNGVETQLRNQRRKTENMEPQLWPLDQLRLELDDVWQGGAGLARDKITKKPLGSGLPRIIMGPTRWKKGFVHADQYSPICLDRGLFSGNIYLQLPNDEGQESEGHLHIWDLNINHMQDWYKNHELLKAMTMQDAEMQMMLRKELGDPIKVFVEPGDCVLLCVQKPHAAVGFTNGLRVSLQCFLQYHGMQERLLIDI